jgi:hypothetical protein
MLTQAPVSLIGSEVVWRSALGPLTGGGSGAGLGPRDRKSRDPPAERPGQYVPRLVRW